MKIKQFFLFLFFIYAVFSFTFINEAAIGGANSLMLVFILVAITIKMKWDTRLFYSKYLYIYFIPFLITPIIPFFYYSQNFVDTIWVQHQLLYVLVYFFLWYAKPTEKGIIKLLMLITIIYFSIRIVQNIVYPMEIVASALKFERGVVRFRLPGTNLVALFGFYSLKNIIEKKGFLRNIIFWLISFISIVLMGTRMFIIAFIAISLLSTIINRITIRMVIFITLTTSLLIFLVIQYNLMEIIDDVFRLTEDQIAQGENYTRVQSFLFYVTGFNVNILTVLFGHGVPEHTAQYGKIIQHYQETFHFHASDIGMFGVYYYYGIVFTTGLILLFIKVYKTSISNAAIKLFILFILLISPTLTPVTLFDGELSIGLVLYLSELDRINQQKET